jgi:hypothetical protein
MSIYPDLGTIGTYSAFLSTEVSAFHVAAYLSSGEGFTPSPLERELSQAYGPTVKLILLAWQRRQIARLSMRSRALSLDKVAEAASVDAAAVVP